MTGLHTEIINLYSCKYENIYNLQIMEAKRFRYVIGDIGPNTPPMLYDRTTGIIGYLKGHILASREQWSVLIAASNI